MEVLSVVHLEKTTYPDAAVALDTKKNLEGLCFALCQPVVCFYLRKCPNLNHPFHELVRCDLDLGCFLQALGAMVVEVVVQPHVQTTKFCSYRTDAEILCFSGANVDAHLESRVHPYL